MNNKLLLRQSEDYYRIEQAIKFIEANYKSRPTLDEMAHQACLSKFHFQRLFKRWAGISPIQFMQFLTLEYAKQRLAGAESLLATTYDAGLSAPGRLHDLFVTFDAMTPGDFKRQGSGLKIEFGFHPTPFGQCLLATTARGICFLGFIDKNAESSALNQLYQSWPGAAFSENRKTTGVVACQIFGTALAGRPQPFHLLLKGTNFQINVWRALLKIPAGNMASYRKVAACVGSPKAFRAVANAIAGNPVAFLIPCHRVIAESGQTHRYRWGSVRKKAMLGWEAGLCTPDAESRT